MRFQRTTVALACGGAFAYALSKIDLAVRGEIGMPGFPAPASAYAEIPDVAAAQLGNAGLGFVLVFLAAALWWPPRGVVARRILIGVNWLGVAMIGAGVVGFTVRAAGLAPALGEPAEGVAAWAGLGVGAVWTVSWALACLGARRTATVTGRPVVR